MTESSAQPVVGSLRARIIRACTVHPDCELECPERTVEELGEIASFDQSTDDSADPRSTLLRRFRAWLEHLTNSGGNLA